MRKWIILVAVGFILSSCHDNPNNKWGGPSTAKDTAASKRDTSSSSTRASDSGQQ